MSRNGQCLQPAMGSVKVFMDDVDNQYALHSYINWCEYTWTQNSNYASIKNHKHISWLSVLGMLYSSRPLTGVAGLLLVFLPSQWDTALLCSDVSHWLGTNLLSTLVLRPADGICICYLHWLKSGICGRRCSQRKVTTKIYHVITQNHIIIYLYYEVHKTSKSSAGTRVRSFNCMDTYSYVFLFYEKQKTTDDSWLSHGST